MTYIQRNVCGTCWPTVGGKKIPGRVFVVLAGRHQVERGDLGGLFVALAGPQLMESSPLRSACSPCINIFLKEQTKHLQCEPKLPVDFLSFLWQYQYIIEFMTTM